jgi:hypothetical protein
MLFRQHLASSGLTHFEAVQSELYISHCYDAYTGQVAIYHPQTLG